MMIPVKTDATPDERPLERGEIEIVRGYLPDLQVVPFHFLGRLHRFLHSSKAGQLEFAPKVKRWLSNGIAATDALIRQIAPLHFLAGYAVLHGHVPSTHKVAS